MMLPTGENGRREEILGLTWDCVDFHQKRIEVKFVRTSAGNVTVQKEPETMTSHRMLHMPAELEDALLRERERQPKLQELLGHTYSNQRYVFSLEDGKNGAAQLCVRTLCQIHSGEQAAVQLCQQCQRKGDPYV